MGWEDLAAHTRLMFVLSCTVHKYSTLSVQGIHGCLRIVGVHVLRGLSAQRRFYSAGQTKEFLTSSRWKSSAINSNFRSDLYVGQLADCGDDDASCAFWRRSAVVARRDALVFSYWHEAATGPSIFTFLSSQNSSETELQLASSIRILKLDSVIKRMCCAKAVW